MPKYLHLDSQNKIIGTGMSMDDHKPDDCIWCTEDQAKYCQLMKYVDGQLIDPPQAEKDLYDLRIDVAFGRGPILEVTCVTDPGIDGKYATTPEIQQRLAAAVSYIERRKTFPGNSGKYLWMDVDGAQHSFASTAVFLEFADALHDYAVDMDQYLEGAMPAKPSNVVKIS